jgi:hypothetical protein
MFEYQPLIIDSTEVEKKLNGTPLQMRKISKKMMAAANREVTKQAKRNINSLFTNHNANPEDKRNPPLAQVLKAKNSRHEDFTSYIFAHSLHAAIMEKGGRIQAKNGKYLTFCVNGKWIKVQGVTIPARPYLEPAIKAVYETGKAVEIMSGILDKQLKKYWEG